MRCRDLALLALLLAAACTASPAAGPVAPAPAAPSGAAPDRKVVDADIAAILARWTGIAPDVVLQTTLSEAVPTGRIDLDDLTRQQDFWAQEGLVPSKVDLTRFVDYKYLDAALAQQR